MKTDGITNERKTKKQVEGKDDVNDDDNGKVDSHQDGAK